MKKINFSLLIVILAILSGCTSTTNESQTLSAQDLEKTLLEKMITAQPGELILLPEGNFSFKRALSLDGVPDLTIKGAGMKKTVLSFKGQIEGAEGLIIKNAKGLTLEGFSVADTKGDAIKVQDSENITFRNVETTWTDGAKMTNGGYGLYPVNCTNVLMEKCEASYASDAGIYVGQSRNVTVRNNYAHHNVAGIEIENTQIGEVYDNKSENNSGGILIFDMPDLPQANGFKIKIYNNTITNNNHENFAPKGTTVATLPPGSGITIMAHKEVEVYNNKISGHKTVGLGMNSWLLTEKPFKSAEYNPFYSAIHVHDNTFTNNKGETDTSTDFGNLITALTGGQTVDIMLDGIFNPATLGKNGLPHSKHQICIRNNGEVSFLNFNGSKGSTPELMMQNKSSDASAFDCQLESFDTAVHDAWLVSN